jgi:hypothetical protein
MLSAFGHAKALEPTGTRWVHGGPAYAERGRNVANQVHSDYRSAWELFVKYTDAQPNGALSRRDFI